MQNANDLSHLCRELYELKDQVAKCVTETEAHQQDKAGPGTGGKFSLLTGIASSYRFIKSSLNTILSNHTSDWIDYNHNGSITYAKFCSFNPDIIRSLHL